MGVSYLMGMEVQVFVRAEDRFSCNESLLRSNMDNYRDTCCLFLIIVVESGFVLNLKSVIDCSECYKASLLSYILRL